MVLAEALLAGKVNPYLNMVDLCQNHFQSGRGLVQYIQLATKWLVGLCKG